MWRTGKFNSGVMMSGSDGDFFGEKAGVGCDYGGADDIVVFIGKKFNEAVF